MKTFLGVTTGLLLGIFVGAAGYAAILLSVEEARVSLNMLAESLKEEEGA